MLDTAYIIVPSGILAKEWEAGNGLVAMSWSVVHLQQRELVHKDKFGKPRAAQYLVPDRRRL